MAKDFYALRHGGGTAVAEPVKTDYFSKRHSVPASTGKAWEDIAKESKWIPGVSSVMKGMAGTGEDLFGRLRALDEFVIGRPGPETGLKPSVFAGMEKTAREAKEFWDRLDVPTGKEASFLDKFIGGGLEAGARLTGEIPQIVYTGGLMAHGAITGFTDRLRKDPEASTTDLIGSTTAGAATGGILDRFLKVAHYLPGVWGRVAGGAGFSMLPRVEYQEGYKVRPGSLISEFSKDPKDRDYSQPLLDAFIGTVLTPKGKTKRWKDVAPAIAEDVAWKKRREVLAAEIQKRMAQQETIPEPARPSEILTQREIALKRAGIDPERLKKLPTKIPIFEKGPTREDIPIIDVERSPVPLIEYAGWAAKKEGLTGERPEAGPIGGKQGLLEIPSVIGGKPLREQLFIRSVLGEDFVRDMRQEIENGMAGKRIPIRDEDGYIIDWKGQPSEFPEYFKNKGYAKDEVLGILDKAEAGREKLTDKEWTILDDLIESRREQVERDDSKAVEAQFKYLDEWESNLKTKEKELNDRELENERASIVSESMPEDMLRKKVKSLLTDEKGHLDIKTWEDAEKMPLEKLYEEYDRLLKLKPEVNYDDVAGMTVAQISKRIDEFAETPFDNAEIIKVRAENKSLRPTMEIEDPERQAWRIKKAEQYYGTGAKKKERKILFLMGPSAAGKSMIEREINKEFGGLTLDSDIVKNDIPEFGEGRYAQRVHEESSYVAEKLVLAKALENGDNIIFPLVGKNAPKMQEMIRIMTEKYGYTVEVALNTLPAMEAARRVAVRYLRGEQLKDGRMIKRFVDPKYVLEQVGSNPDKAYEIIKNMKGVTEYGKVSNDVPRGEPPKFIEGSRGSSLRLRFGSNEGREGVREIDTKTAPEGRVGSAAEISEGKIKGVHVTSDSSILSKALNEGMEITKREGEDFEDLGSGVYFSAAPQLWTGRAFKKFDFLKDLSINQRKKLANEIIDHPNMFEPGYLTKSEKEIANRDLERYVETGSPEYIAHLAGQPYNIKFWESDFLKPLGIEQKKMPEYVPIEAQGKFADITDVRADKRKEVIADLKKKGFSGALLRGGFSTEPQVVVWDKSAITKFGDKFPGEITAYSEDFERYPSRVQDFDKIAVKVGGKIYSEEYGKNGVYNHWDLVEKHNIDPEAPGLKTGFLKKVSGVFISQAGMAKIGFKDPSKMSLEEMRAEYAELVKKQPTEEQIQRHNLEVQPTLRELKEGFLIGGKTRGRVPIEKINEMALNNTMSLDQLANLPVGTAVNAETIQRARLMVDEAALESRKAREVYRVNPTPETLAEAILKTKLAADVYTSTRGMMAEAGRTLRILREPVIKFSALSQQAKNMLENFRTSGDAGSIQKLFNEIDTLMDSGNVPGAIQKTRSIKERSIWDSIVDFSNATLVFNPSTHVVNMTGNTLYGLVRTAETPLAGMADFAISKLRGTPREVFAREGLEEFYGITEGFKNGMVDVFDILRDTKIESGKAGELGIPGTPQAILDRMADAMFRPLGIEDAFAKSVAYQQSVNGQAYRIAKKEGLSGEDFVNRVAGIKSEINKVRQTERAKNRLLKDIENAERRGDAGTAKAKEVEYRQVLSLQADILKNKELAGIMKEATERSLDVTFQQPLEGAMKDLNLVRRHPGVRVIVPFYRTIINLTKAAFQRTPFSLIPGTKTFREIRGKEGQLAQARAAARQMMGTLIMAPVAIMAYQGLITGGGPKDEKERKLWNDTGRKPYSFYTGTQWIPYRRFEPVSTVIALIANAVETIHGRDEKGMMDKLGEVLTKTARYAMDQTFWTGIQQVNSFMQGENKALLSDMLVGRLTPPPVAAAARIADPVLRERESLKEEFMARIPGLSKKLYPVRDLWGEPVKRTGEGLLERFLPNVTGIYPSAAKHSDVAEKMLQLEEYLPNVAERINKEKLTLKEKDVAAQIQGRLARRMIEAKVRTPGFDLLPEPTQAQIIKKIGDYAHDLSVAAVKESVNERILENIDKKLEKTPAAGRRKAIAEMYQKGEITQEITELLLQRLARGQNGS